MQEGERLRYGTRRLSKPAPDRDRDDPEDGFSGIFSDRLGIYQICQGKRYSGGPGPRFGRRLAGCLLSEDHGRRSAAVRSAVRAIFESGTHLDAGYRYRFLHPRPRRGDQARDGALRAGIGLPDHHFRNDGVASRDQGRRTGAQYALRRCRKDRQAHPAAGPRAQCEYLAGARTGARAESGDQTIRRVKELVDLALRLEGCSRHTSVHAAGVVISPKPLHELVPIAMSVKNEFTSQYPMGDLEKVGMLKMDFLGLTTLRSSPTA